MEHILVKNILDNLSNPVIFELGANDGSDTIKYAKIKGSIIHAFEPDPRAFYILYNNLKHYYNVKLNNVAISNIDGISTFIMSDKNRNKEWLESGSLLEPKNHLIYYKNVTFIKTKIKVLTTSLDNYCFKENITNIDFIHADIQGAEKLMIEGGKNILSKTKVIYTEYSNKEMYEKQPDLDNILKLLPNFHIFKLYEENVLLLNKNLKVLNG